MTNNNEYLFKEVSPPAYPVGTVFYTQSSLPSFCVVKEVIRETDSHGRLVRVRYLSEREDGIICEYEEFQVRQGHETPIKIFGIIPSFEINDAVIYHIRKLYESIEKVNYYRGEDDSKNEEDARDEIMKMGNTRMSASLVCDYFICSEIMWSDRVYNARERMIETLAQNRLNHIRFFLQKAEESEDIRIIKSVSDEILIKVIKDKFPCYRWEHESEIIDIDILAKYCRQILNKTYSE